MVQTLAKLPRVTVITATFNASATVQACLQSVREQDYPELEHIVVDAASTDGTQAILAAQGPSLRWISEPDRGIYDAWNKGLAMATGEWVAFLGADDVYLPGAVRAYMDFATLHPGSEYISAQVEYVHSARQPKLIGGPWNWRQFRRFMCVSHVGSMHHRALFKRYGLYDTSLRIVADYEFLLRAGKDLKAAFLQRPTVRMRAGGVSGSAAALREAALVKRRTGKVSPLLTQFDLLRSRASLHRWK